MRKFFNARSKLEDSRQLLQLLKEPSDAITFRSVFNSLLNSIRAIADAMKEEGASVPGFEDWYSLKKTEMMGDELLQFIHDARIQDFHHGKHTLKFATLFHDVQMEIPPGAKATVGAEGAFWIVDEGTPQERRVPMKHGGKYTLRVSILNAPTRHKGATLSRNDPFTIYELALDYLANLVYEAENRF